MMFSTEATWEFFSPFAHVPGRYEWCRIHSPTHGSFDTFIVLGESTGHPPTVYVNSESGRRFMADRYPESRCISVAGENLCITEIQHGGTVTGFLEAGSGPVRNATMRFSFDPEELPEAVPYGGPDFHVWGSRWVCEGVDLVRSSLCTGEVLQADGSREVLAGVPGVVTAGSVARIT